MTEDRTFKYALMLSLLIHIGVFWRVSYSNIHFLKKPVREMEIIYPNLVAQRMDATQPQPAQRGMKVEIEQPFPEPPSRLDGLVKDISKLTEDFFYRVQKQNPIEEENVKRTVSVPAIETQEIKNPLYLDYYQQVRSRIRDRAYANFRELASGEVYITFIVDSAGALRMLRIIEDRTQANQYLRRISQRSVEEASPFPPFPSELAYPELSFNVVISFKVE